MDDAPEAVAPFGPVPFRPVPVTREPGGLRLRRLSGSTVLAAAIHVGFTALFLVLWRAMVLDVPAPDPPTAEFIVLPPSGAKPPATPAIPSPPPSPAPAKAAEPPPPAPPPPSPAAASPARPDPAPPEPSATAALDEALKPALLEPPPEAKAAATQASINQAGNTATAEAKATEGATGTPSAAPQEPAKPAAAPEVLTTADSATTVPAPARGDDTPTPPTAGDPTQASRKATEQLAAALPMSTLPMPLSFRAALSAQGTSSNAAYRGSVFGALERARQGASGQAQARQLKGQVVLAIVLTATGDIDKVTIVQSSGSAAADAFAIDMVRRAAPFPPPPPGASRTFTPAIAFGNG